MDIYTHGHQESVVAHHSARTVANSAAFLIPHLQPGQRVLDIGCGPGTITTDLAGRVAPGQVSGRDAAEGVVELARQQAQRTGVTNAEFAVGDVYNLDFEDQTFDIVYAHQLLQHLTDPVRALREMRRVLKSGGLVAVRDADYGAMVWAPAHEMLGRWMTLYHEVTARNGAEADAGRYLLGWLQEAGLDKVNVTTSTWTYADASSRKWWGLGWERRATESAFADQAIEYGLADRNELEEIAMAWRWWADQPDGFFVVLHADALGRR